VKSEGQKQSLKHEKRLEKALGGQRSAASGAFWSRKGDVRTPELLIEHKWTGKKSFTIKADVVEKIWTEAILDSRTPVLGIHLNGKNYVLLDEDDFIEIHEYRIEHECTTTNQNGLGGTKQSVEE
jgi:Holliday junction resolvase